jgi:predicted DNA-binding protein YlxM (UPF0122 family)
LELDKIKQSWKKMERLREKLEMYSKFYQRQYIMKFQDGVQSFHAWLWAKVGMK